jgi:putative peptide maturation dehydrogenase
MADDAGRPSYARRTRYLFLRPQDDGSLVAVSVLKGEEVALDAERVDLLLALPADRWTGLEASGNPAAVLELARHGLVVTDGADETLAELRRRDEQLAAPAWNRYAALYHSLTRWRGVRAVVAGEAPLPRVPGRWPPPPHFHRIPDPAATSRLPVMDPPRPLYDLLRRRKTTRGFDPGAALSLEELATVLRWVWGCHGTHEVTPDLTILKKTSPSGGSQHPGEVYPLVRAVEGVEPGLYHYAVEAHELEQLEPLTGEAAADLVVELTAGQEHFRAAQVLFLLTARFPRNFWKYQAHAKAYRAVLFDAAHLSQTLYLVCADLGLGAFVSGAINEADIDRRLGLRAFSEAAILVCGCGRPVPSDREPPFRPFAPRRA